MKDIKADILKAVGKDSELLADLEKKYRQVQLQADAMDLKMNSERFAFGGPEVKSFGQQFTDSEEFAAAIAGKFNAKRPIIATIDNPFGGRKSIITTTSGITAGVSGVTMPMRLPGVTGIAQQALRIRDLMTVRPMTSGNAFDFVQQITRTNAASPQIETSPKGESTYGWNTVSDTVKTIAHFVNVSRQAIEDVPWLGNHQLRADLWFAAQRGVRNPLGRRPRRAHERHHQAGHGL